MKYPTATNNTCQAKLSLSELFKQSLLQSGISPPDEIIPDGNIHRFAVAGDKWGAKSGWYVLYDDEVPAGAYGDWRQDINETWCSKETTRMTEAERAEHAERIAWARRQSEAERKRLQEECGRKSLELWERGRPASKEHPYVARKGITPYGARQVDKRLLMPVVNETGALLGLQFIAEDGSKRFKVGTPTKGNFFLIGEPNQRILVCEGYATGCTLHEATGEAVAVAFNAGNLVFVAEVIKNKYKDLTVLVCADDDHMTDGNPGMTKASEAAKAVEGLLATPSFNGDRRPEDTDFNDLAKREGIRAVVESVGKARAIAIGKTEQEKHDELRARILAEKFEDRFIFVEDRKSWFRYREGRWEKVSMNKVAINAPKVLRKSLDKMIAATTEKEERNELLKVKNGSSILAKIKSAIEFMQGFDEFTITSEHFDTHPWIINCKNGTFDLRSGELRPHDPKDLCTVQANFTYDKEATCPKFIEHLEYFLPDADVRRYFQRILGISLIGGHIEETLPIWWGTGSNGKTTTAMILQEVFGDYAASINPSVLAEQRYGGHDSDITQFFGKRMVFAPEMEDGAWLSESRIKRLTGGDMIAARYLYGEKFQMKPTWTIFLQCNQKPRVKGSENAIWRRLRLIPWTVQIDEDKRKPQNEIIDEMRDEFAGIFNWAYEGLLDYLRDKKWVSEKVMAATKGYREEEDIIGDFLEARCELGPNFEVKAGDLYKELTAYREAEKEKPISKRMMGIILGNKGFKSIKKTHVGVRYWTGLKLKDSGYHAEEEEDEHYAKGQLASDEMLF